MAQYGRGRLCPGGSSGMLSLNLSRMARGTEQASLGTRAWKQQPSRLLAWLGIGGSLS